jgi:hypothetical protein
MTDSSLIRKSERHGFLAGVFNTTQGATTMTTKTTSRRAILAGAAASLPALAAASAAPSIGAPQLDPTSDVEQLARVEQMIDLLRTRTITDGWKLDEAAADRVLQFFRTSVQFPTNHEDQPRYDDEWSFVRRFINDHGQSWDWILEGDITGMITRLAVRSRAGRAAEATTDPIFALIEAHRDALAEHERCVKAADVLPPDEPPAGAEAAMAASHDAEYGAMIDLLNTQPTTQAGIAALAQYAVDRGGQNWIDVHDDGSWTPFMDCLVQHVADTIAGL